MENGGDGETQKDMLSMIVRNVVVNDFIFMIDYVLNLSSGACI